MDRVRKMIHADVLHKRGILGRNVTAAIMDSGICAHPDYIDRVVCFKDFVGRREGVYDDASHGSHVTGILGGNGSMSRGRYCGIAPACDLVHLKVLDRKGAGKIEDAVAAMDWVIRNREKFNIRVLNFSVGTPGCEEKEEEKRLLDGIERVWDSGITVVVAAGNMGPERGSITVPGTSSKVITVGFYDACVRENGRRRCFYSGRGPAAGRVCKPELTAPGVQITSCSNLRPGLGYYSVKSGSSMATPIVSGAACLLLSEKPWLTNAEVKTRLEQTAEDLGLPKEQQGWGRIDLRRLLEEA